MHLRKILRVVFVLALLLFATSALQAQAINQDDPWSVHTQDYYGRNALSKMENADGLLYAYDQIAAGVEVCEPVISVKNDTCSVTISEINTVLDVYRRDYAQHFWLGNSWTYSYDSNSLVTTVTPTYNMTGTKLEKARVAFDAAVNEILFGIEPSMSDFEKELYIHDRLAERITYYGGTSNAHNAYGAIVEGYAVCEGYAEALQYLLEREGIRSFIVIGYGYSDGSWDSHAWNYVCIDDVYYHVDLTWNDAGDNGYHEYFNTTDSAILEDHYISPVDYELPVCNSMEAFYHTVNGTLMDTYTVDSVAKIFKENNLTATVYISGDLNSFMSWLGANHESIAKKAGIQGSYSLQYSWVYREYKFSFVTSSSTSKVAMVYNKLGKTWHNSVTNAVSNANGGYVKLLADCTEDLIISKDLHIDLNGFDMTGKITVTSGATLYGMDSSTNDYDCSDDYGTVTNLTGSYAPHFKTDITGMTMHYLAVNEDGVISFHRFYAGIVYMSVQPCVTGLGYKAIFAGDEMVIAQLDEEQAFGYELGIEGGHAVQAYKGRDSFVSGKKVSLRVNNFDIEHFGENELYAHVMIKLNDGTVIESAEVSMTMRSLMEYLNDHYGILNNPQLQELLKMIAEHPIIKNWDIGNFI